MNKFFVTTFVVLSMLSSFGTTTTASAVEAAHGCTLPNSKYIPEVGCVFVVTDPDELARQLDPATGQPIQYRKDVDPNCDGKHSGYIYHVPSKHPETGVLGQTAYKCD